MKEKSLENVSICGRDFLRTKNCFSFHFSDGGLRR
jgi:hypothetical protein